MKVALRPYLLVLGIPILLAIVGVVTNSGRLGWVLGGAIAMSTDPIVLVASLLLGMVHPYKRMVAVCLVGSLLTSLAIDWYLRTTWMPNSGLGVTMLRASTIFVEAHIVSLVLMLLRQRVQVSAEDESR